MAHRLLSAGAVLFLLGASSVSAHLKAEACSASDDTCNDLLEDDNMPGLSLLQMNANKATKAFSKVVATDTTKHLARDSIGAALVQQHLTICNAYRGSDPLNIMHVDRHVQLTKDKPLKYKDCQEFTLPLMEGDRLDFKAGGADVGTFHATSMPKTSASLLLIPRHREGSSKSLAFDSHAFADLKSPQIAVVDAYHGNESTTAHIIENLAEVEEGKPPLTEALRFGSVVAVAPGKYNVALLGQVANANLTVAPLRAGTRAKCVIMRVGGGKFQGLAFPQELVVFPNSGSGRWISWLAAFMVLLATHH